MSIYKHHSNPPQPDAGRSGRKAKLPRDRQHPDVPRPGPKRPALPIDRTVSGSTDA